MNDLITPNAARVTPQGYELPDNLEPVFDPISGEFVEYRAKADEATLVQTEEDVTGTPVDVDNTVH